MSFYLYTRVNRVKKNLFCILFVFFANADEIDKLIWLQEISNTNIVSLASS